MTLSEYSVAVSVWKRRRRREWFYFE